MAKQTLKWEVWANVNPTWVEGKSQNNNKPLLLAAFSFDKHAGEFMTKTAKAHPGWKVYVMLGEGR
jgi:hypothetical protein